MNIGTGAGDLFTHRHYGAAVDTAFLVFGSACLAWSHRELRSAARVEDREHIVLLVRLWPGMRVEEIAERMGLRVKRTLRLLERMVATGELVRDGDHGLTFRVPGTLKGDGNV
jgi:hypothetical protein